MKWDTIDRLLSACTKNPGTSAAVPSAIPAEYEQLLRRYNGLEGFVGPSQYLILWPAEQLMELNTSYSTNEFLPGVILIGTDGANTGFGVRTSTQEYVTVPLVGMSETDIVALSGGLEGFFQHLATRKGHS